MILEIDNIVRNIADIRKSVLALTPRLTTTKQNKIKDDIEHHASEMEFSARVLEFELNKDTDDPKRQ